MLLAASCKFISICIQYKGLVGVGEIGFFMETLQTFFGKRIPNTSS